MDSLRQWRTHDQAGPGAPDGRGWRRCRRVDRSGLVRPCWKGRPVEGPRRTGDRCMAGELPAPRIQSHAGDGTHCHHGEYQPDQDAGDRPEGSAAPGIQGQDRDRGTGIDIRLFLVRQRGEDRGARVSGQTRDEFAAYLPEHGCLGAIDRVRRDRHCQFREHGCCSVDGEGGSAGQDRAADADLCKSVPGWRTGMVEASECRAGTP